MAEFVLLTMSLSAILYALFAGADFGAGMVEAMLGKRAREAVDVAIAPVWEANHVWLILVVVLAFVGFPEAYARVSQYLHIPLTLMLLGIVARGSAFTFRHYDPAPGTITRGYSLVFRAGSVLTPLCLGLCLAATASGRLTTDLSAGFFAVYVAPWNTWFGWTTGAFVCTLFAFEGAALLAAERGQAGQRLPYLRLARRLHLGMLVSGAAVVVSAHLEGVDWLQSVLASPFALAALAFAALLAPATAYAFERGHPALLRLSTGAQLAALTVGFFAGEFPVLVHFAQDDLLFAETAAPPATLRGLCWALVVGLLLIVPALLYLIVAYKRAVTPSPSE